MLSCEYCGIFKNSFFIEHLRRLLLELILERNTDSTENKKWLHLLFDTLTFLLHSLKSSLFPLHLTVVWFSSKGSWNRKLKQGNENVSQSVTLRKKCPYLELLWSAFSGIRTEYREILSPYSVRMRENADQNNFEYGHFLRHVNV